MNIPQPYYNHYGGRIAFGPDGMLYIGKGDGGWEGDPLDAGQTLSMHLGKLLRINVDTPDNVPYSVPEDNPFARADYPRMMSLFGVTEEGFSKIKIGAKPEIWAYGLRNPYMFHFDAKSGDLFIADVGQNSFEEINWQPKSSKGGENYGWKHNQASHCHPTLGPNDKCPIVGVLPIAEYPHQEPTWRTKADGRLGLFGPGNGRRQLRRDGQDLHRRRLVLRTRLGHRLGQEPRNGRCRS